MNKQKTHLVGADYSIYAAALVDSGTPHRLTLTGRSAKIEVGENEVLFSGSEMTPRQLHFVGVAKKEIIKNAQILRLPDRRPRFTRIYPGAPVYLKAATEIDISGAYWNKAFSLGLLSQRTYLDGLSFPKPVRLVAFGAAATIRQISIFDGIEYSDHEEQSSDHGRAAFFYVADQICRDMGRICEMIPTAALLYWVDAIVCLEKYSDFVCRELFSAGYEVKKKSLCDIITKDALGKISVKCKEADTGRIKEFLFFKRRKAGF